MRKNDYNCLNEFTSQYIGEWGPSDGHWLGLDFSYKGSEYRLHTGPMYEENSTKLDDGREALFGLYKKSSTTDKRCSPDKYVYILLGEYADMQDLLNSREIDGELFQKIIMDDDTELLGQD